MIDMTDIPASWSGRDIRVRRPGVVIEGLVTRIESEVESIHQFRAMQAGSDRVSYLREIGIQLSTREGPLSFTNIREGSYTIELIEEN